MSKPGQQVGLFKIWGAKDKEEYSNGAQVFLLSHLLMFWSHDATENESG